MLKKNLITAVLILAFTFTSNLHSAQLDPNVVKTYAEFKNDLFYESNISSLNLAKRAFEEKAKTCKASGDTEGPCNLVESHLRQINKKIATLKGAVTRYK